MSVNPSSRSLPRKMTKEQLKIIDDVNDWFGRMTNKEKTMARRISISLMGRKIYLTDEEKNIAWYVRQNRKK